MKPFIVAGVLALLAWQAHGQSADTPTHVTKQTAGSHPQRVEETPRSRAHEAKEHWTDGMNTKRSNDTRERDEYGAPKVTPPKGQGTDNSGGLPKTHK
ncbi:hypothetical protein [Luteibacter sp. CQ10]|uniref:hypothetical protein n=1 Tax=Luteibacter sp. CQ10 TaxID=2805821 RepID=UPI0034A550B2